MIRFVKAYYPALGAIAAVFGFFPFLGLLMCLGAK